MAKIKKPNIGKDVKQSEVLYIVFLEYKNGIIILFAKQRDTDVENKCSNTKGKRAMCGMN